MPSLWPTRYSWQYSSDRLSTQKLRVPKVFFFSSLFPPLDRQVHGLNILVSGPWSSRDAHKELEEPLPNVMRVGPASCYSTTPALTSYSSDLGPGR